METYQVSLSAERAFLMKEKSGVWNDGVVLSFVSGVQQFQSFFHGLG